MSAIRCLLLSTLAACGSLRAESATDFRQGHQPIEIADGITAFIADESPGGVVQGNITVISGRSATLVVDSGQYQNLAQAVVDHVREQGLPPVRYLINTHWHGDHLLGNAVFKQAYPNLILIQHSETARVGTKTYADWRSKRMPELIAYPERLLKAADSGVTSKGVKLTDEQRQAFRLDAALIGQWLPHGRDTDWMAPDLTIDDDISVDLGERKVAIKHLGKANTTGDLLVFDPQSATLISGDVLVAPTPYSFGSYHSEWIDTLIALRALAPKIIVPGHGQVMHDDAYVRQLEALLAETRTQVRAAIAEGLTLDEIKRKVTLPEFERRFAGEHAQRQRAFRDFYLTPGIEQAYKEAKGEARSE